MSFSENLKSKQYWIEVLKLTVIFFVLFMGFSLLISHFSDVMSGDFANIYQEEWADGKWVRDVLFKGGISLAYSMYQVNRRLNTKANLNNN